MAEDKKNSEDLLSTKAFINSKCKKDHLSSNKFPSSPKKSIYNDSYNKSKLKTIDFPVPPTELLGQTKNLKFKGIAHLKTLNSMHSTYRNSFEGNENLVMERGHERPSYFLKQQNYETMISEYKRKMSPDQLKPEIIKLTQEKGKPQLGNLLVPKYNKMTSSSEYGSSYFQKMIKLPSIHTNDSKLNTDGLNKNIHHKNSASLSTWGEDKLKNNKQRLSKIL